MSRSRISRQSGPANQVPLGSLTQRDNRHGAVCSECGSARVTRLAMRLTDGTPVQFTSCHRCDHRTWESDGAELTRDLVLSRAQKPA
ncbi:MAG: hypothetical protein ACJ71T_13190 [Actinomycetales bacterium]|jgi:DNA-directed RNA polymerase subunit M/transcription elongation factor TFIIS